VRVVAFCSWQETPRNHPTVIVIHGLEGSAEAGYVYGTASKAFRAGFNVIRYNVRNCGGTAHLTPTLYHSGLTVDLHRVLEELITIDRLPEIFFVGFSMGANQSLKLAGELGDQAPPELRGICAISPPLDLEECSRSIGERRNFIYEYHFLRSLRKTMREKARLFPERYDLVGLDEVRSLWEFDELMGHHNGFDGALDYYTRSSSRRFIGRIEVPTLIIHAQDDPFIPMSAFAEESLNSNPWIIFLNPEHGGHVAFCSKASETEDRAWAENRAVQFCSLVSQET
jgi:predicted alpha/beta-fold hydrolase